MGNNNDLWKHYELLVKLRSDGDQGFHSLTSTHVTANSLLIAAMSVIIAAVNTKPYMGLLIIILSYLGLILSWQMASAQQKYWRKNKYWESKLEELEQLSTKGEVCYEYFTQLKSYEGPSKSVSILNVDKFRRMRVFPVIFIVVYVALMVFALGCIIIENVMTTIAIVMWVIVETIVFVSTMSS